VLLQKQRQKYWPPPKSELQPKPNPKLESLQEPEPVLPDAEPELPPKQPRMPKSKLKLPLKLSQELQQESKPQQEPQPKLRLQATQRLRLPPPDVFELLPALQPKPKPELKQQP